MNAVTTGSLWEKHRGLAYKIAAKYDVPGYDTDDLRQEALIALWMAARSHNEALGPFGPWAGRVIDARLIDLLRKATRTGRHRQDERPREVSLDGHEPTVEPDRQLRDLVDLLPTLTKKERAAIAAKLNGTYSSKDRSQENALTSARRKIRAA